MPWKVTVIMLLLIAGVPPVTWMPERPVIMLLLIVGAPPEAAIPKPLLFVIVQLVTVCEPWTPRPPESDESTVQNWSVPVAPDWKNTCTFWKTTSRLALLVPTAF